VSARELTIKGFGKLGIATVVAAACAAAQDPLNRIDMCMSGAIETLKAGAPKTSVRCELKMSETLIVLPSRAVTKDDLSRLNLSENQIEMLSGFYETGTKARLCILRGSAQTSEATGTPGERLIGRTLCIVSRIGIRDPSVVTGTAVEVDVEKSSTGAPTLVAIKAIR